MAAQLGGTAADFRRKRREKRYAQEASNLSFAYS
jgi:hypothetical protein